VLEVLKERYAELNETCFHGRLPQVAVRVSRRMTSTAGQYDPNKREIAIASRFVESYPDELDSLLLHEMVHISTGGGHGSRFREEWERLRASGAPVSATYQDFRHCVQFAPSRPRPFRYLCPECGDEFPRTRPFGEARWCGKCVNRARRRGEEPFAPHRRLVTATWLVGTLPL
jgi:predicted SprT family Zn-dependent metalloprotease